jgi:hypothetical protein
MYQAARGPGSSVGIATGYGLNGPGIQTEPGGRYIIIPDEAAKWVDIWMYCDAPRPAVDRTPPTLRNVRLLLLGKQCDK